MIWNSGTITRNSTIMHGAGGVHVSVGSFTMADGEISYNTAVEVGGGLHAINSFVTLQGGRIVNNTVTAGRGGVHIDRDTRIKDLRILSITGGEISNNTAMTGKRVVGITMESNLPGAAYTPTYATEDTMGDGGGLYIAGTSCIITGGEIKNNIADNNGGGIAVSDLVYKGVNCEGSLEMISGVLTENTAGNLGGGIYINDANVIIGVEGCDGTGEKHTTGEHTDKNHPVVCNNTAEDSGGGIAMEGSTSTCDIYCCDLANNQLSNGNRGRGYNVYITGGTMDLHGAVGAPAEPELVIVDGTLKRVTADADVTLYYYENNAATEADKTAYATRGEYFHLPDAQKYWTGSGIFMGWTFRGPGDEDARDHVRVAGEYYPVGEPLQADDAIDGSTGDSAVHMYALWAPESSLISYSGCVVDGVFRADALTVNPGNPTAYTFRTAQNNVTLIAPEADGYTFQGWYIYQDANQNANWGYEPAYQGGQLNPEQLQYFAKDATLDLGSSHFGNITLVPKYTENETTYTYYAVGPQGVENFGTLSQNGNQVDSGWSYTLKMASGTAKTVTATAVHRYQFKGWYSDPGCTQLVSENPQLTVEKTENLYTGGAFYAKFDYYLDDLTIICNAEGYFSGEQSFIYEVWHDGNLVTTVTLKTGESVVVRDLLIGEDYTVKQLESWSWRFVSGIAEAKQTVTLPQGGTSVTFNSTQNRHLWLTHDTAAKTGNG